MTVNNAHAYCDESGNTGANLLDPHQPVLVVGGWVVADSTIEVAEHVVTKYIHLLKPRINELHGVQLLKSEFGTRSILNLIHELCKLNCLPICQFAEKRYMIAGHIVDIFLAPESNPFIPESFDFNHVLKPEIGSKLYQLSDKMLTEFAEAYDTLDRQLLLDSLRKIATALSLRLETKLADLMMGSLRHIDTIIEENTAGRALFPPSTMTAINIGGFHMFYQYLEGLGRTNKIDNIHIVHDDSPQFRTAFRVMFEAIRDIKKPVAVRTHPRKYEYFGFKSVKDLTFADSKKELLLQAADVLISAMYRYSVNIYKERHNPTALLDIARLLLKEPPRYPVVVRTTTSEWYMNKLYDSV